MHFCFARILWRRQAVQCWGILPLFFILLDAFHRFLHNCSTILRLRVVCKTFMGASFQVFLNLKQCALLFRRRPACARLLSSSVSKRYSPELFSETSHCILRSLELLNYSHWLPLCICFWAVLSKSYCFRLGGNLSRETKRCVRYDVFATVLRQMCRGRAIAWTEHTNPARMLILLDTSTVTYSGSELRGET